MSHQINNYYNRYILQLTCALHFTLFSALLCYHTESIATELITSGWIEKAKIYPKNITLLAKLDTGAKTSSINASNTEFFTRDGKPWCRFGITNKKQKTAIIEAPIVRTAIIKRHFEKKQRRPVIQLDICIGSNLPCRRRTLLCYRVCLDRLDML